MQEIAQEILLKEGRMEKSPLDMTSAERNDWYKRIQKMPGRTCFLSGNR
jgi:hypothetical protein